MVDMDAQSKNQDENRGEEEETAGDAHSFDVVGSAGESGMEGVSRGEGGFEGGEKKTHPSFVG